MDQKLSTGVEAGSTPFEFNGEIRTMDYVELDDNTQLWSATVSEHGAEKYATCFFKEEELWLFRYRSWDTVDTKIVLEIYMYFDNGDIFYGLERSSPPGSNMNPSQVLQMPFHDSERSKKELNEIFNRYYPLMKSSWEKREK